MMDAVTKEAEAAADVMPGNVTPAYALSANFVSRLLSDVVRALVSQAAAVFVCQSFRVAFAF